MQIISYKYDHEFDEDTYSIEETKFGKFNLLVGDTGTGKTRLLNTIYHLCSFITNDKTEARAGHWNVTFKVADNTYKLHLEVKKDLDTGNLIITNDHLCQLNNNHETVIIHRTQDEFVFNGMKMPKLPSNKPSIGLLHEEEVIKPIYRSFSYILRRRFSQDGLDLVCGIQALPQYLLAPSREELSLEKIFSMELLLNVKLYLLSELFPDIFINICNYYKNIFPFIVDTKIYDFTYLHTKVSATSRIPVFCIKEKGINKWMELAELSSGMQKVLLILTDIHTLPQDGIYLIDEYENSLGINAINFFPEIVSNINTNAQLFVTSHHPYIINNVPIKNWYVFHRKGSIINIQYGDKLVEKYGKSKQQAFINLINDPFYKDGIE